MSSLPQMDRLIRLAGEVASIGGWELDLASQTVVWSDQVCRIHEVPSGTQPSFDESIAYYSPADRERVRAARQACVMQGTPFDQELQITTARGNKAWVRFIGRPAYADDGRIVGIYGTFQDVTKEHQFRDELSLSRRQFREFAQAMPHIAWTATANGQIDFINHSGADPALAVGAGTPEHWSSYLHPEDRSRYEASWRQALREGNKYVSELRLSSGEPASYRWFLVSAVPIRNDRGEVVKWYGSLVDIHDRKLATEQAADLARRLTATMESMTDAFFLLDHNWNFSYLNGAAEILLQRPRQQLLGKCVWEEFPEASGTLFFTQYQLAVRENRSVEFAEYYEPLEKWFQVRTYPSEQGLAIYFHDISKERLAQAEARESKERFDILAKATADVVWDWDLKSDLVWWNQNGHALLGMLGAPPATENRAWEIRLHPEDAARVQDGLRRAIDGADEKWSDEYRFASSDGSYVNILDRGFIIRDKAGHAKRMVGSMTDITARTQAEDKIHRLAFYDPLTQLPNRGMLQERLLQAFRSRQSGALLFIDLDNFKTLNDSYGHDKGDLLLQQIAGRLCNCVRKSDTVARLGGDEFVILLLGLEHDRERSCEQATAIAEKVVQSFTRPCILDGYIHYSTASVGVSLFDGSCGQVSDVLKRADLAMYQAKNAGRNTIRFFDPEMENQVAERAQLEADLRFAFDRDQFVLHFQPQVSSVGKMIGAEALIRWRHPARGLMAPVEFIQIAEETGHILRLGSWILQRACRHLAQWAQRPETASLVIAVNVSARQFRQPEFVDLVFSILREEGVSPERLSLELTESILLDDVDTVITKMTTLQAAGIRFSLDDFGTGYSSLSYLKRLPLNQLKIDRSFVVDIPGNSHAEAIVRTIINMGAALGLSVLAEGVETAAQAAFLAAEGCHNYQGFHFSTPLPMAQLEQRWLQPEPAGCSGLS